MQLIIVAIIACLIFAVCFAILLLKARKADGPVKFHMCGHGNADNCQCNKKGNAK